MQCSVVPENLDVGFGTITLVGDPKPNFPMHAISPTEYTVVPLFYNPLF